MAESKVIAVTGNGTYKSVHGMLYKFEYAFEDGTTLSANHKTKEPRFQVGEIASYTVNGTKDGFAWGKVERAEGQATASPTTGMTRDERIERQWAINAAIELCEFKCGNPPDLTVGDIAATARELLRMRDTLETYNGKPQAPVEHENLPF